ncbi:hypothetical protein PtA15_17A312 [Puccinia triticina]|uniref:UBC core domain-containing protein n=1 Tax=Puccinia triticina TaxID=208348 RepID=A0ABY7D6H2_9BASI|nr:uncharacterized protein PtA15_17A312 [Puccinia triticina]WAQ92830.1 hypothetical protein PtA15_17A312 [Puccinia triticina]WAR63728.1 hypothetical protein PtB15_17B329 [Puccinia triticina]
MLHTNSDWTFTTGPRAEDLGAQLQADLETNSKTESSWLQTNRKHLQTWTDVAVCSSLGKPAASRLLIVPQPAAVKNLQIPNGFKPEAGDPELGSGHEVKPNPICGYPEELSDLQDGGCPVGCSLIQADDLVEWKIKITGPAETVFEHETFVLRFRFSPQYPIEAPEVVFVVSPSIGTNHSENQPEEERWIAPEHPHIYVCTIRFTLSG